MRSAMRITTDVEIKIVRYAFIDTTKGVAVVGLIASFLFAGIVFLASGNPQYYFQSP